MRVFRKKRKSRLELERARRRKFDMQKFLASLLVVSVPLMIFCLSANVVMRISDVYEYSLDASGIMDNTTLATSKDDVVYSITSYMQHKSSSLSLMENVEYEPQELFSDTDRQAMAGARLITDIMLIIGLLAFLVTAIVYFLLIRWRVKGVFMKRFKLAMIVFFVMAAGNIIVNTAEPLRNAAYGIFVPTKFPDGDNLVMLLSDSFPMQVSMFEAIIGVIVLLVLLYITWSVAGQKKMFKRF